MRTCTKCHKEKELELFKKVNVNQNKSGYGPRCKACHAESMAHSVVNRAKANINNKKYKKTAKGKVSNLRYKRGRRVAHRNAKPAWRDNAAIDALYAKAKELGLTVDHMVPLKSDFVCGLHWEGNMQLMSGAENGAKNNLHWPDM